MKEQAKICRGVISQTFFWLPVGSSLIRNIQSWSDIPINCYKRSLCSTPYIVDQTFLDRQLIKLMLQLSLAMLTSKPRNGSWLLWSSVYGDSWLKAKSSQKCPPAKHKKHGSAILITWRWDCGVMRGGTLKLVKIQPSNATKIFQCLLNNARRRARRSERHSLVAK
jgi:hypothetical protein